MEKEAKQQIRNIYKAKRDRMPSTLASQLSASISEKIFAWETYRQAQKLFFYYPLGNEVSLLPVIYDALKNGKHAAFPKTTGCEMEFYEIANMDELKEGRFHIMEPASEGKDPVRWIPDICFVPGIAFDTSGARLGYGGGYYDRYFADKGQAVLAGCAYAFQIADSLPANIWDIKMRYVLSENGIATC